MAPQPFAYEYGVKDDYSSSAFQKAETQDEYGVVTGSYKVTSYFFIIISTFFFFFLDFSLNRVACPKFGHPAPRSIFYYNTPNTKLVAAVGMLQKNYYQKAETISKVRHY